LKAACWAIRDAVSVVEPEIGADDVEQGKEVLVVELRIGEGLKS
jgi:hypothetical protein